MADEEHLDLLKHGVRAFNQWRKENPFTDIDLSGAYLGWAKLIGAGLD